MTLNSSTVCVTLGPDDFIYTTFLDFYHDNIYNKDFTLGVFIEIAIWTHLFIWLLPLIYFLYRERARSWPQQFRIACAGLSFRKWMIWLSGGVVCGVEIILYLWSYKSWIIILTFMLHMAFVIWGLLLVWALGEMDHSKLIRLIGDGHIDKTAAVRSFIGRMQRAGVKLDIVPIYWPDSNVNTRETWNGEIRYPELTEGSVTVPAGRILTFSNSVPDTESQLYEKLFDIWTVLPSFSRVAWNTTQPGANNVPVVGQPYDNPQMYQVPVGAPDYKQTSSG